MQSLSQDIKGFALHVEFHAGVKPFVPGVEFDKSCTPMLDSEFGRQQVRRKSTLSPVCTCMQCQGTTCVTVLLRLGRRLFGPAMNEQLDRFGDAGLFQLMCSGPGQTAQLWQLCQHPLRV